MQIQVLPADMIIIKRHRKTLLGNKKNYLIGSNAVLDWVRCGFRPKFKKITKSSEKIRLYWFILEENILKKDSCLYQKHEDSMMTVRVQLLILSATRLF